jgi:exodeoxyribonuclease VII small subunit
MTERRQKDEVGKLTFEEAIQQLKGIVDRIEQGEIPLQDSLEQYEKGMALIKHCRDILQNAEKRIEKISKEEPPEPKKEPEDSEPLLGG